MWWVDQGRNLPCCHRATDEELEAEPELFDCDTCEVARTWAAVDPVNVEAWDIYHRLGGRYAQTLGLGAYLLEALTEDWDGATRADMVARLEIIMSELDPPKTVSING